MISVIVPVYNTEEYLDQCISSLIQQEYKDLEILLVDDGSTDGSAEILDQWRVRDPRIIVIHCDNNIGVSAARNIGLERSTGDYIAFVDSDDWLEPFMYFEMMKYIEKTGADIAVGGFIRIENNQVIKVVPGIETGTMMTADEALLVCMPQRGAGKYNLYNVDKLFRRTAVEKNEKVILFDTNYSFCEDVLWLTEVILNSKSVVFWQDAGYNYRVNREGNTWTALSQYKDLEKCKSAVETNDKIHEMLSSVKSRAANNQLQRVLYYKRYAFRTASKIGDKDAYKEYRRGYYKQLLEWYGGNKSFIGFKWLIRQVSSDVLFQVKKVLKESLVDNKKAV